MLGRRRRRRPNINPALGRRLALAGKGVIPPSYTGSTHKPVSRRTEQEREHLGGEPSHINVQQWSYTIWQGQCGTLSAKWNHGDRLSPWWNQTSSLLLLIAIIVEQINYMIRIALDIFVWSSMCLIILYSPGPDITGQNSMEGGGVNNSKTTLKCGKLHWNDYYTNLIFYIKGHDKCAIIFQTRAAQNIHKVVPNDQS